MPTRSPLSSKQAQFALAYARHHNASQATREAGYAHGCASVTGARLLANASVLARIRELEAKAAVDIDISRSQWLTKLQEAAALAKEKQDPMAMIAAWREIGKACGFYEPKQALVTVNLSRSIELARLQELPDSELLAMIDACNNLT